MKTAEQKTCFYLQDAQWGRTGKCALTLRKAWSAEGIRPVDRTCGPQTQGDRFSQDRLRIANSWCPLAVLPPISQI